jgi:predicted transcriptional regulator
MEKKMNNKFSIGVVIAIVLQVSAFVWWTAQQAQTITQLETAMAELTAKTEQEKQFNLQRDVADLKAMIADLERRTGESFELLAENMDNRLSSVYDDFNEMGDTNNRNNSYTAQVTQALEVKIAEIVAKLQQIDEWAEEYDMDLDELYYQVGELVEKLREEN